MIPIDIFRQPPFSPHCLHVFPITRNCLAPPHVPESRTERCIPQCIYSPRLSVVPCEFVFCMCVCLLLILKSLIPDCKMY